MEDQFYNDGFEEFLQRQVKDSRMYPSDGLWRNIYKEVHGDTTWPGLTFAAFAFLAAIIFISIYFSPSPDIFEKSPVAAVSTHKQAKKIEKKGVELVAASSRKTNRKYQPIPFVEDGEEEATEDVATTVVQKMLINKPVDVEPAGSIINFEPKTGKLVNFDHYPANVGSGSIARTRETPTATDVNLALKTAISAVPETEQENTIIPQAASANEVEALPPAEQKVNARADDENRTSTVNIPLSLTAVNRAKNRFSYTVHIGASRSYRELLVNEIIRGDGKAGPVALNHVIDVNKVVRHKPGTGIEAGVSFMYNILDKLQIRTGVQFNIRQYAMSAYLATTEVATIGLINRAGGLDSVGSYAVYRNANGYRPTELVNRFYQVAIPIGLQWQVVGNRNIQLNVAASVQPTYSLNRDAYLISTDYKNYTQNPDIMRNWNINTSFETFVTINSGDFKWQLGPQVRYQNLPTFIKAYPIREYLIDYGFKLGVSKHIR